MVLKKRQAVEVERNQLVKDVENMQEQLDYEVQIRTR